MSVAISRRVWFAAALAGVGGCARWVTTSDDEPSVLPPARMSPDSVVLELAFVRLAASDQAAWDSIWTEADEQHFPPELRKQLSANGLRQGILGQQLPSKLREALDSAAEQVLEERAEDVSSNDTEVSRGQRRLQCRTGRRAKIVVTKTFPRLPLLTLEDGQIRGNDLREAQGLLALKPYPLGDGRVRLEITPEVEHGEMKTQWVGQESSLMQRLGRERLVFDRLRSSATIAGGQVLVISTTSEVKGLGEHFFSETAGGTTERTLLLLRVAQTQLDHLFAPEQMPAPLATPAD
ncbi:MAG: hypothetical protein SFU86_18805 [Pirellulaceae bacterium]|nr:hypothetical protein [Pirellulaceae bacterium]